MSVQSKLIILSQCFPKLKILWSTSHEMTAQLFSFIIQKKGDIFTSKSSTHLINEEENSFENQEEKKNQNEEDENYRNLAIDSSLNKALKNIQERREAIISQICSRGRKIKVDHLNTESTNQEEELDSTNTEKKKKKTFNTFAYKILYQLLNISIVDASSKANKIKQNVSSSSSQQLQLSSNSPTLLSSDVHLLTSNILTNLYQLPYNNLSEFILLIKDQIDENKRKIKRSKRNYSFKHELVENEEEQQKKEEKEKEDENIYQSLIILFDDNEILLHSFYQRLVAQVDDV